MADLYLWPDGWNTVDDFSTRTATATPITDAVAAAADTDTLNFKSGIFTETALITVNTKRLNFLGANDGIDPVDSLADRLSETVLTGISVLIDGVLDWAGYRFSGFTWDGTDADVVDNADYMIHFDANRPDDSTGEFIYENNIHRDNWGQLWKYRVSGAGDSDANGDYEIYKKSTTGSAYYMRNAKGYVLVMDWGPWPFEFTIYDGEADDVLGTSLYTATEEWFIPITSWSVTGGTGPAPTRGAPLGWAECFRATTNGVWGGLSFRYRYNRDIRNHAARSLKCQSNGSIDAKLFCEYNHITTQYGVLIANMYNGSYVKNNTFQECWSQALTWNPSFVNNDVEVNDVPDIQNNQFIDCGKGISVTSSNWYYRFLGILGPDYQAPRKCIIENNTFSTDLSKLSQAFNSTILVGGIETTSIKDNTIQMYGNISENPSFPNGRIVPAPGGTVPNSCMVGIDIRGADLRSFVVEGNTIDSGSPQGTFDFPTGGIYIRSNHSTYGPFNAALKLTVDDNDIINWQASVVLNGNSYPVVEADYVTPEVELDFTDNRFQGSLSGADNAPAPSAVIDASRCWWGDDSGPSGGVVDPDGNRAIGDGIEVTTNVRFGFFTGSQVPIPDVCLGQSGDPGSGGVGSGGTTSPGQSNEGAAANTGFPVLSLVTDMNKTLAVALYRTVIGEEPSDLNALNVTSLKFKVKEMLHHSTHYINKSIPIPSPERDDGVVFLDFNPSDIPYAGMWYASVIGYNAANQIVAEWPMWLEIRKSIDQMFTGNNPITISGVRLLLRDTVPEENNLLLEYEWSDTEIAFCIMRPIEEWNEMLPPVKTFTGATFPYRENWRKAAAGYLMRTAARKYLRDDLQYSAGGLSVNDKRKWDAYEKLGQKLVDEWRDWAKQEKVRLNSLACYGGIGSGAFGGWRVN